MAWTRHPNFDSRAARPCAAAVAMALAAAALAADPAAPTPPPVSIITLASGEIIRAVITSTDGDVLVVSHPILGEIRIPKSGVAKIDAPAAPAITPPPTPAAAPPLPAPLPAPALAPAPAPAATPAPQPPPAKPAAAALNLTPQPKPDPKAADKSAQQQPPKTDENKSIFAVLSEPDEKSFYLGWKRTFELGLNGTTGPTDAQNVRSFLSLNRQTKKQSTLFTASYAWGQTDSRVTQNRAEVNLRHEWTLQPTRWRLWTAGRGEIDANQTWEGRIAASTGVGYSIWKSEDVSVIGRFGIGGAVEIEGSDEFIPELGIAAVDGNFKFTDRFSSYANAEYYPDLRQDWEYRSVARAGLQWLLDPANKLTLRLGVEYRFDSRVDGKYGNVVDYFLVLGLAF